MSPETSVVVMAAVAVTSILVMVRACGAALGRIDAAHDQAAAALAELARVAARVECEQLARSISFRLKGIDHALRETRRHCEATAALVEEIVAVEDSDRPDLSAKGM